MVDRFGLDISDIYDPDSWWRNRNYDPFPDDPADVPPVQPKLPCGFAAGIDGHGSTVVGRGTLVGYNQMTFFGNNQTKDYVYEGTGTGLDGGFAVQAVAAYGSGEWTGDFSSISLGLGPIGGSIFWSPGPGGWIGFSFGLGMGTPTIAHEKTVYYDW